MPNTTYYQSSSYGYNIYTVIPTNVLTGFDEDSNLVDLFTNTATLPANNAAICQSATQPIIHEFGFDSLTSGEGSCGSTTTKATAEPAPDTNRRPNRAKERNP